MRAKAKQLARNILRAYGKAIAIGLGVALLVRIMVFEPYRVETEAMMPALIVGDVVFVSKWAYGLKLPISGKTIAFSTPPRYGDVVLTSPPDESGNQYLKRVIGLPGDRIALKGGHIVFNDLELSHQPGEKPGCELEYHPHASYEICSTQTPIEDFESRVIPPGYAFVIGNTRGKGASRRPWAIVPFSSIDAKVTRIWFSRDSSEGFSLFPSIRWDRIFKSI